MEEQAPRSVAGSARARLAGAPVRRGMLAAGAVLGLIAAVIGGRVAVRGAQLAADGARLGYAAARLRLYRRCPDCRRWMRGDARLCHRCGWRRRGRRIPRVRRRF